MSTRNSVQIKKQPPPSPTRPPILWTRVLIGFALNVMVVTLGVSSLGAVTNGLLLVLIGPALFGILTALLAARGGTHAFFAGMLSIPFLAFFIFPSPPAWGYAILCGGVFALAGLVTDLLRRLFQ